MLAARAFHLLGAAEFRLLHVGEALDALTAAQKAYQAAACESGAAQVLDTLGMVHQGMGNETAALVSYARSLALKTKAGDRYGAAITLGNLGRYCAMLGRGDDARGFLALDLTIAQETGDARGQARMLTDLATLDREAGDLGAAREKLGRAHDHRGGEAGLRQLEFETLLELALTALAAKNGAKARDFSRTGAGSRPAARRRTTTASCSAGSKPRLTQPTTARAAGMLLTAADGFRDADIPSLEIEARLALARARCWPAQQAEPMPSAKCWSPSSAPGNATCRAIACASAS